MDILTKRETGYVGRFAPSPTGPLHFGSLVAAVASYLDARSQQGSWHLRIEDLDPARESASAANNIIQQLELHGLNWDGDILYQSERLDSYEQARDQLTLHEHLYPCICTRKETDRVYSGRCLNKAIGDLSQPHSLRFHISESELTIQDRLFGQLQWTKHRDMGDFIVRRKDGLDAYQLAVVVDDIHQGITDILRGADLIHSTPLQVSLFKALREPHPRYCHIPVVLATDGRKLSKQAFAEPISSGTAVENIRRVLNFLNQKNIQGKSVNELLRNATITWNIDRIPKLRGRSEKT
ncbi:MAG: tRNA glutamyl-Q(34) synthetase GluQRS [Gammaproteobacteria bacterium]|jgi:glutamyl-Q tRNA(Asp) synthetase|nr:tRNA glutamyl-Q(34) synthetase GluQRS [Gammaproteobacteria bacterium]